MTKVNTSKKSWIISGLLTAGLLLGSSFAAANSDAKALLCDSNQHEVEMNPFIEIDFAATLKKLPDAKRKEAQSLSDYLATHDSDFETLMAKEDRLHDIVCHADVEVVTVNLLDKLSQQERTEAETLWQDIQKSQAEQDDKLERLHQLLNRAE